MLTTSDDLLLNESLVVDINTTGEAMELAVLPGGCDPLLQDDITMANFTNV